MAKIYLLLAALSWTFIAEAQKNKDDNNTDSDNEMQILIENLMQDTDQETFDFDTQFEYLENYVEQPINLNTATEKE